MAESFVVDQINEERNSRWLQMGMAAAAGSVAILASGCSLNSEGPYLECSKLVATPHGAHGQKYDFNPIFVPQNVKDLKVSYDFGNGTQEIKSGVPYITSYRYTKAGIYNVSATVVARAIDSGKTISTACPEVALHVPAR